jgi:hypothetical protein
MSMWEAIAAEKIAAAIEQLAAAVDRLADAQAKPKPGITPRAVCPRCKGRREFAPGCPCTDCNGAGVVPAGP